MSYHICVRFFGSYTIHYLTHKHAFTPIGTDELIMSFDEATTAENYMRDYFIPTLSKDHYISEVWISKRESDKIKRDYQSIPIVIKTYMVATYDTLSGCLDSKLMYATSKEGIFCQMAGNFKESKKRNETWEGLYKRIFSNVQYNISLLEQER